MDAPIGRPEVPQQQRDPVVREGKDFGRQVLLMRALIEDAESLQPGSNARGMPAIAIARDDQLMPETASAVPCDGAAHRYGRLANRKAVFLGGSRITQGLMQQVASVSDQVP